MEEVLKGKVKFFNEEKGYGFIQYSDGNTDKDMFFHISAAEGVDVFVAGDCVEFIIGEGRKGPTALEIVKA